MSKRVIETAAAPQAIGPYSQAVAVGDWVFCSGQIALDPGTGERVTGDVQVETRQVLRNLAAVLEAAGASLEAVVKTTVYLRDMDDFPAMNEIYAEFFSHRPPARATVAVRTLPKEVAVEIDAVAWQPVAEELG
ncbi:MAG: RidA family protein [Planctomycetota bacterium]